MTQLFGKPRPANLKLTRRVHVDNPDYLPPTEQRKVGSFEVQSEWVKYHNKVSPLKVFVTEIDFEGQVSILGFGLDIEEDCDCIASYSVAIAEMPDGTVQTVPLDSITFTDSEEYPRWLR